ncbi:hypothetical protein SAMN05443543_101425 [Flavobacterium flevense]|nr:hypothetical protein SAMN05443543_101425 [Flavobacterium flevense]
MNYSKLEKEQNLKNNYIAESNFLKKKDVPDH